MERPNRMHNAMGKTFKTNKKNKIIGQTNNYAQEVKCKLENKIEGKSKMMLEKK